MPSRTSGPKARSSTAERCPNTAEAEGSTPFRAYQRRTSSGLVEGMTRFQASPLMARREAATPPARLRALLLLLALGPLAGCAGAGPTASEAHAPRSVTSADYVIGPGDVLNVFVYHAPDLSATLPVRPDGRISVPLIPDVQASGKTPSELGHDISQRLEKYVKEPNVTVMVTSFTGPFDRQIKVVGEAVQPTAIPYRDHMTLLDVMIEAKGLTRFAAGNRAEIVRGTGATRATIPVHLSSLLRDGDISQNVEMRPGDTLIIPQTWF